MKKLILVLFTIPVIIMGVWVFLLQEDPYSGLEVSKNAPIPEYDIYSEEDSSLEVYRLPISVKDTSIYLKSAAFNEQDFKRAASDYLEKHGQGVDVIKLFVGSSKTGGEGMKVYQVNTEKGMYAINESDIGLFTEDQKNGKQGFPQFAYKVTK